MCLTFSLIEAPFDTFANRADPDQGLLCLHIGSSFKSCLIRVYSVMIRYDPTLKDLTRNFFVLCTNVKVFILLFIVGGAKHEYS